MKYKHRYTFIYQDEWMKLASHMLSKLDLGFEEIGVEQKVDFTCNAEDVKYVKEILILACELCGGKILHIEGGLIE